MKNFILPEVVFKDFKPEFRKTYLQKGTYKAIVIWFRMTEITRNISFGQLRGRDKGTKTNTIFRVGIGKKYIHCTRPSWNCQ